MPIYLFLLLIHVCLFNIYVLDFGESKTLVPVVMLQMFVYLCGLYAVSIIIKCVRVR